LTTQFVAHKLSWFSTDHVGVLLPKIKKKSPKYKRTVGYPSTSWASCTEVQQLMLLVLPGSAIGLDLGRRASFSILFDLIAFAFRLLNSSDHQNL